MAIDTPFLDAKGRLEEAASWLADAGSDTQEFSPEESLEAAREEVHAAMRPLYEVGFEQKDCGFDPVYRLPMYETVVLWPRAAEAHDALDAIWKTFGVTKADDLPARAALATQVRDLIPTLFAAELDADKALHEELQDKCPF